jgi:hypothetical protein
MKELKITLKKGKSISNKVELFKNLFDFNSESEVLEIRITGKISNSNYGVDKVRYELVELKNKEILLHNKKWDAVNDIDIDLFIYNK